MIPTGDLTASQDRARKTNSNIFVEEPDVFIMPNGTRCAPPRERTPEVIPFKPLLPLPQSDDQPLKPLLPPPPIPPKTYVQLKFDEKVDLAPPKKANNPHLNVEASAALLEAKQSNVDSAKTVKFRSDVKFPADPPPLPSRGGSKVGVTKESNKTRPSSGMFGATTARSRHEDADPGIVIVTKDGTRIGEVISCSNSHSDYDRLLPVKPLGPSSDYDRLLPTATLVPSDDMKIKDNLHEESKC